MNVNIMEIEGTWDLGYVLDWHVAYSEFLGHNQSGRAEYDTVRTEIGEALFQLKYRSDLTKISPLASTLVDSLKPFFPSVSFVVPMPPSKSRTMQPLSSLAKKIAELLEIPFFENILLKKDTTPQIKDIELKEDKIEALTDCFYINESITNDGCWDVLIVDDLYASGASLSAATQTMRTYSKVHKIFVAAFTRTKSS